MISVLISTIYFDRLPLYYLYIRDLFFKDWSDLNYIRFVLAGPIIIIPTLCMGILFPIVCDLLAKENKNMSQIVGKTYALNSIGAMIGSICAGLFVIPTIGLQYTIYVGCFLTLFAGLIVLLQSNEFIIKIKILISVLSIALFLLFIFNINSWSSKIMSSGVHSYANNYYNVSKRYEEASEKKNNFDNINKFEIWEQAMNNYDLLYYKDGLVDSVAVMKDYQGIISLMANGKVDASAKGERDVSTQIMIGQLPMILHPNPKNVFLVGYASRITAGSILTHPITKLDAAEISPSIVEASKLFNEFNNNPLEDKRMNLKIADAKHTLMTSKENYNVIISQPSNPWIKGQSSLFALEWYKIVENHLTKDGLFMQWLPTYNISENNLKIIINTLSIVFPNVTLWSTGSTGDLILLASKNKDFKISYNDVIKKTNYPKVKEQLEKINLDAETLLKDLFLKNNNEIQLYLNKNKQGVLKINSDDLLITEYTAPKDMVSNRLVNLVDTSEDAISKDIQLRKIVSDLPEL